MILTNKLNLPQPFVDAATNDHEYTEGRYSVTELLGGTCEAILKRRHADDIEEDVSDRVWAILGTAVHEILRQAEASESQIQENWLSVKLEGLASGYELSGIFDLYDDSTGTVTDYKTAGTIKWQKQDFEDYRMQTLLYCWLLQQIGFAAWNGEIVMILRDWSKVRRSRCSACRSTSPTRTWRKPRNSSTCGSSWSSMRKRCQTIALSRARLSSAGTGPTSTQSPRMGTRGQRECSMIQTRPLRSATSWPRRLASRITWRCERVVTPSASHTALCRISARLPAPRRQTYSRLEYGILALTHRRQGE